MHGTMGIYDIPRKKSRHPLFFVTEGRNSAVQKILSAVLQAMLFLAMEGIYKQSNINGISVARLPLSVTGGLWLRIYASVLYPLLQDA